MSNSLLLESAVRTLLMGALIYLSLRLFRVRAVRAQRAAWLLALAAALAMPAIVAFGFGPRILAPPHSAEPTTAATSLTDHVTMVPAPHLASVAPVTLPAAAPIVWPTVARDVYLFISATLLAQLLVGLVIAWRIRAQASKLERSAQGVAVRASSKVATPVTIASTVILPADFNSWSEETFKVVLSHESAHVRQRDFWVRLFAQLHCALFWFNPFAWWLKRQLADLGEALSDHAATQVADSHASYAELLLRFARRARWPYTVATVAGIGMAHSSNLSSRIDRLLSEQGFKSAFAESPRGVALALAVTVGALCAASATTRVQAAVKATAPSPIAAVSAVNPPAPPVSDVEPPPPPPTPPLPAQRVVQAKQVTHISHDAEEEGVMAIHLGGSLTMWNDFDEHFARQFEHAHANAKGDYVYFREGEKSYLVQDPNILNQARQMLAPTQDLRRKQEDLSRRQRAEADRQRDIGREERDVSIQTPDFQEEIARLNKIADEMRAAQGAAQMKPEQLGQLQAELGDIQGNLGALEGRAYAAQAQLGSRQAESGERQAKLGEEQAKLGEQQAQLGEQARKNLKPLIEKAIREGTVSPLD